MSTRERICWRCKEVIVGNVTMVPHPLGGHRYFHPEPCQKRPDAKPRILQLVKPLGPKPF